MDRIKLGIIGAGKICRKHLETISKIKTLLPAGIYSRTPAKAQNLAKEFKIPYCTEDIDSLIRKAKPDALIILVSQDQIYHTVLSTIEYGLPLFIEKPAGLCPEETLQLANAAKKYAIPNMVGFNRRFYSIFHKGLELIRSRGDLFGVAIEGHERIWKIHESNIYHQTIIDNWIFANSVHTIDLLRFFGGEPKNLQTICHRYKEINGDQFSAIMEFENGAIGNYRAHWYSPGGWSVILYGNGITVEFKPLEKGFLTNKDFKTEEIIPDDNDIFCKTGFYGQMKAFEQLIRCKKKQWPMSDLNDTYKTMLLAKRISSNIVDLDIKKGENET